MKNDFKKRNRQLVVFKMLANANRIKILQAIINTPEGILDVKTIAAFAKISQPKVSDHLKLMRINKIVSAKQLGANIFYSVKEHAVKELLKTPIFTLAA